LVLLGKMFTEGLDKNALRWVREVIILTHYRFFMFYANGFLLIYLIICKVAIFCLFAVVVVCCAVYRKNVMKLVLVIMKF
jgi:hypothetical protein